MSKQVVSIAPELAARVEARVDECMAKQPLATRPRVFYFDGRRAAGVARPAERSIGFNATLLRENTEAMLRETVPHEYAHLFASTLYGPRIRAHGREWGAVMRALGAKPERCHSFDTANVQVRRQRRFPFQCGCRTHMVSTRRRNAVRAGRRYLCVHCRQRIREVAS